MKSKSASRAGLFEDLGRLTLRVGFGVLIMFHGVYKVRNGVGAIQASLLAEGLPPVLAYGVYMGELVAPSLIILGAFTRPAAMVLALTMLTAMYLMYADQFGALTGRGGWGVELPAVYLLAAIAIALLGPGRFSVGKRGGLLN
ncbi:MAG: DoxX family protein [Planctomycetaceae bacterium]